ncbi:endolytic peptidoglycan transglycosylase RlpA [Pantoea sp. 1.19]|uniref:endolytic peptidoglycan transglycosylase RlpA n=1 Tax=Pantoea sp. 1.19 TaxID=1925589 RepID=UPI000948A5D0|nr:endolytic peptidoglycan transglycosylase RlpA [Pantoea sp. 1.19]
MRKDWLWIAGTSVLLAACSTEQQPAPVSAPAAVCQGPVTEIGGTEPRYEPVDPRTSQDYRMNGKTYRIVSNPATFSETGLAAWYGDEASGKPTALGETFDPDALTAAHPTLPLPSYVRVTNLANGRQLVVRVNDRGPYTPGRIIDLSRAAGDRLNLSNNTRVRLDAIVVAPDGSLSGPGSCGTVVAKQSYALPARPDLGGSSPMGSIAPAGAQAAAAPAAAQPIDNRQLQSEDNLGAPVQSSGFLGAPQPLASGVLEGSEPAPAAAPVAAAAMPASGAPTTGNWGVQVAAVKDASRARMLGESLGARFNVAWQASPSADGIWRVQLGQFSRREQAQALLQRLSQEAQQSGFVVPLPATR